MAPADCNLVIGILNRWRQFGRRYFWPHLLLGMVAAALGIPSSLAGKIDTAALPNTSSSFNRQNSASGAYNRLLLLQEARSRLVFSIDYRHQHALSTIICHLSFALALQTVYMRGLENETEAVEPPSQVAQLALLSTLNALLTHEPKPPPIIRYIHYNVLCPHWPCIKPDCGWRRCWAFAPGLAFSANFAHWATKTPNTAS